MKRGSASTLMNLQFQSIAQHVGRKTLKPVVLPTQNLSPQLSNGVAISEPRPAESATAAFATKGALHTSPSAPFVFFVYAYA
jgi:hypothetical protein